jgi:hypothetical protein
MCAFGTTACRATNNPAVFGRVTYSGYETIVEGNQHHYGELVKLVLACVDWSELGCPELRHGLGWARFLVCCCWLGLCLGERESDIDDQRHLHIHATPAIHDDSGLLA